MQRVCREGYLKAVSQQECMLHHFVYVALTSILWNYMLEWVAGLRFNRHFWEFSIVLIWYAPCKCSLNTDLRESQKKEQFLWIGDPSYGSCCRRKVCINYFLNRLYFVTPERYTSAVDCWDRYFSSSFSIGATHAYKGAVHSCRRDSWLHAHNFP